MNFFFVLANQMPLDIAPLTPIEIHVIAIAKKMREERRWSQKKLAELLHVKPGFIGNIESPKRMEKYNLNHINELATIFECSPQQFLPTSPLQSV